MSTAVLLRRADGDQDMAIVADMWTRSTEWLRHRGYDQWQYPVKMHNIRAAVADKACWLAFRAGVAIGTMTLDTNAEPQYWPPEDQPDNALYIHRMVVDVNERGSELGSALLDWAGERACDAGRDWLRLDAWRSNTALHTYYVTRGFKLVRVVPDPSGSGACFQRPAALRVFRGPRLIII